MINLIDKKILYSSKYLKKETLLEMTIYNGIKIKELIKN